VHFDASAGATLRLVLTRQPSFFIESDASSADAIIFETDDIGYIASSKLYHAYKSKSICITESDIPTFRLPGLYAANETSYITKSRTKTVNYFISENDRPNLEVKKLAGHVFEKRYLYSFMGGANSWARKRLFRYVHSQSDTLVEATDSYNHWAAAADDIEARAKQTRRYAEVMAASRFTLCPRGCGLSSYRLFESMSLGVAPVIISDKWRPIEGVDWSFAIFLRERHIPELDRIVRSHQAEWESRGSLALSAYKRYFEREVIAGTLHRQLVELLPMHDPGREAIMAILTGARAAGREAYWVAYGWLKHLVLTGFHVSGLTLPIKLHQPVEQQLAAAKSARRRNGATKRL
jgi:hypothetical protein